MSTLRAPGGPQALYWANYPVRGRVYRVSKHTEHPIERNVIYVDPTTINEGLGVDYGIWGYGSAITINQYCLSREASQCLGGFDEFGFTLCAYAGASDSTWAEGAIVGGGGSTSMIPGNPTCKSSEVAGPYNLLDEANHNGHYSGCWAHYEIVYSGR